MNKDYDNLDDRTSGSRQSAKAILSFSFTFLLISSFIKILKHFSLIAMEIMVLSIYSILRC
jgi:hypothetical protein